MCGDTMSNNLKKKLFIIIILTIFLLPLLAIDKLDQEISIAETTVVHDSVLMNLYHKGYNTFMVSDPVRSINYLKKSAKLYEERGILTEKYFRYTDIGQTYHRLGMHHLALEYLFEASSYLLKIADEVSLAWLYSDIGNVYYTINQFEIAQPYYEDGLKLMINSNHKYGQSVMLNNIALCNVKAGKIEESFKNFEKALKLREQTDNIYSVYHSKYLIAHNYTLIGDDKHATKLFADIWENQDYDVKRVDESKLLRANSGLSLFRYYVNQKDYPTAEKVLEESINIIREVGDYNTLGSALAQKAQYYQELNRNEEALQILKEIFDYAYDHDLLINAHRYADMLVKLNLKQNNTEEGVKYYKYYQTLTDSLLSYRATENLVQLHSIVQNHYKEVENTNLKRLNRNSTIFLIVSSSLFLIIVVLIIVILLKDKKALEKIKKLADASSEGIVIHDRGHVIDFNKQFRKMIEAEKAENSFKNLLNFANEKDKENFKQVLYANEMADLETKLTTSKGNIIDVKINSRPFKYHKKEVRIAVIQDVTPINEYINSLIDIQKQLQVLNTTKDRLFSIIGHDLKNPFNAIIGFSELMKTSWRDLDPKEIDEMLVMINESSSSAHTLLENLLDWARIQTEQLSFNPTSINIRSIIKEIMVLLNSSVRLKKINVLMHCEDSIISYADYSMVSTIIRNLLTNAIKFTHIDGVININVSENQDSTLICIEDNGVGMTQEDIDNIYKIDKIHSKHGTQQEKGTGLGLILCHELVEINKGELIVESELGKGSKFTVTLPRMKKEL